MIGGASPVGVLSSEFDGSTSVFDTKVEGCGYCPDGHKVIIYNKANEQPNQEPGDVHFVVNEKPHAVFTRVSLFT